VPLAQMGRHRKKALLIISDGNDTSSHTDVLAIKRMIRETEVLVYAIGIDSQTSSGLWPRRLTLRSFQTQGTLLLQRRPPREQDDNVGNQTTADYMWLPVHIADPMQRLDATRHSCEVMKEHIKAAAGADTLSVLEIVPPTMLRLPDWIASHNKRGIGLDANVLMSNVVGPREPLYWGRIRLANWISMGQVRQGMGINVTVWTYTDKFNLCILADRKLLPDGWVMMDRFRAAFAEYEGLAARVRDAA